MGGHLTPYPVEAASAAFWGTPLTPGGGKLVRPGPWEEQGFHSWCGVARASIARRAHAHSCAHSQACARPHSALRPSCPSEHTGSSLAQCSFPFQESDRGEPKQDTANQQRPAACGPGCLAALAFPAPVSPFSWHVGRLADPELRASGRGLPKTQPYPCGPHPWGCLAQPCPRTGSRESQKSAG